MPTVAQTKRRVRNLLDAQKPRSSGDGVRRAVYFRRADGKGTQTWGEDYADDMEANKARNECYLATGDATMVWAQRSDQTGTLGAVLTRHAYA